MSDVTPPINSPAALLGWAVSGLIIVAAYFLRQAEKARGSELSTLKEAHAGEVASLKAQLEESKRREAEVRDQRDRLGRLYDAEREARGNDAQRMALAIVRRTPPEAAQRVAEDWVEVPTGVHDGLGLVAQALAAVPLDPGLERRLGRYASGDPLSTPPEGPATRPRLPPRPR